MYYVSHGFGAPNTGFEPVLTFFLCCFTMFDVFGHFEAGKKIGTGPANYTDVKKAPPGTFLGPS